MKILNASQIKACDQFTILNEPICSIELMNRAGLKLYGFIQNKFLFNHFTILCGPGNNGGDGLVLAQLLKNNHKEVDVYILKGSYSQEFIYQFNLVEKLDIRMVEIETELQLDSVFIHPSSCIIDALYGIGITRPIEGLAAHLIQRINALNHFKIAIDLPSGLSPDCSFPSNPSNTLMADVTLSIQLPKLAFMFAENESYVGEFHLIDIGLSEKFMSEQSDCSEYLDEAYLKTIVLPRPNSGHKGTFGHALLIAGSPDKVGASILSAKAIMRTGCGLLTVLVPEEACMAMNCALPEAMLLKPQLVNKIIFEKYNAIGIGPGLGIKREAVKLVKEVVENHIQTVVIDADALNIIASSSELKQAMHTTCILTPHPKEFDRLTKIHDTGWERFLTQKEFSKQYNVTVVLKGQHTCITTADGKVYFNSTGNSGMATAGSGDVLTGIITSLCTQGYSNENAALLGVFLHGYAGDCAAEVYSKTALIASDIINYIGAFFKKFEKANVKN